jgi:hypothetical protein
MGASAVQAGGGGAADAEALATGAEATGAADALGAGDGAGLPESAFEQAKSAEAASAASASDMATLTRAWLFIGDPSGSPRIGEVSRSGARDRGLPRPGVNPRRPR